MAREDSTAWLATVHQGHYPVRPAIAHLGKWIGAGLVGPGFGALVVSVGMGLDARTGALLCKSKTALVSRFLSDFEIDLTRVPLEQSDSSTHPSSPSTSSRSHPRSPSST